MSFIPPAVLAFWMPQGWEWIIIAGFGLLIFGKRLPEVGRSLGKGIVEFKRGLKSVGDEIDEEGDKPELSAEEPHKQITASAETPEKAKA